MFLFLFLGLERLLLLLQELLVVFLILLFLFDLFGGLTSWLGSICTTSGIISYILENGGDHLLSHLFGGSLGTEGLHNVGLGLIDSCLSCIIRRLVSSSSWSSRCSRGRWLTLILISAGISDRGLTSLLGLLGILLVSDGRFLLLCLRLLGLWLLILGRLGLSQLLLLLLLLVFIGNFSGGGLSSSIVGLLGLLLLDSGGAALDLSLL